ncbi:MAG: High-affinity branched-chain amino acid transport ATP-binding protein LivF [Firmicutes bacterium]|nr:High-affinity branched-chain amino acid transport ATP-binding protein LivF [candidate division NPL-UPA2 bacterium]MBT9153641.1 High-affinity branched-chain amino acid transport ATP-binding protein LivF [candidate division NPL-UPA2 bacterium]
MKPLLKVEDISSFIGPFHILQGVSLEVYPGEVVVILGRNGAGKTTTLRSIIGQVPPARGQITLDGVSLLNMPTHMAVRAGIGYVPEDYGVFDLLTVEENLKLAMRQSDKATLTRRDEVLDIFPDLGIAYKRLAMTLSGGQRQMLSISRALVNDDKIILIDEPSKGLAPIIVERIQNVLMTLKKKTTIVLVEQNFALACAVGDRYYIINEGRTVLSGTVDDLIDDTALQQTHLGLVLT